MIMLIHAGDGGGDDGDDGDGDDIGDGDDNGDGDDDDEASFHVGSKKDNLQEAGVKADHSSAKRTAH